MPITERQRLRRSVNVGASDLPALLGCDYSGRTAVDLYLERTRGTDDSGRTANDDMELGNLLEAPLLDWASAKLGRLVRNQPRRLTGTLLLANLDAVLLATGEPVEAKTSGIRSGRAAEEWGEPGTDEVPDRVIVQVHGQMLAADAQAAWVAALLAGRGLALYRVARNERIATLIRTALDEFAECLSSATPPRGRPQIETLQRLRRTRGPVANIPNDCMSTWLQARTHLRSAEEAERDARAALLEALGDCEDGECAELGRISYREQTRRTIDANALRNAHAEIADQYTRESSFRVLRHHRGDDHGR